MTTRNYWYTTSDGTQAGATRAAMIEITPSGSPARPTLKCVCTVIDLTTPLDIPGECPDYCGTVDAKYEKSWVDWVDDEVIVSDMLDIIDWPLAEEEDNV